MSSDKPREFWFEYMQETNEYGQLNTKPPYVRDNSFELVHVIEFTAFQAVVAERDELRKERDVAASENITLKRSLDCFLNGNPSGGDVQLARTVAKERDELRAENEDLKQIAHVTDESSYRAKVWRCLDEMDELRAQLCAEVTHAKILEKELNGERTKADGLKAALEKLPVRILCIDTYDEASEKDLMDCVAVLRSALKAYGEAK